MQPGPIGEPGNAPAWNRSTCWAATIVPSFFAPIFRSIDRAGGRPGTPEHVFAGHLDLHRLAGLRDSGTATGSR